MDGVSAFPITCRFATLPLCHFQIWRRGNVSSCRSSHSVAFPTERQSGQAPCHPGPHFPTQDAETLRREGSPGTFRTFRI